MRTLYVTSLLGIALVCGCAKEGYQTAEKADASLEDTKTELITDKAQLKTTVDALNDLVYHPHDDMRPQYMIFSKAVDDLEKDAMETKKSTSDMVSARADYLAQWRDETMNNQDADLRERAMKRIADTQKRYDNVNEKLVEANSSFDPLLSDLKAVRDYISTDLTSNGIKSITDRATSARNRSITVDQKISAAINTIDGVTMEMAPMPSTQSTTQPMDSHDMGKM